MRKDTGLRQTLHNPDYWLGPEEEEPGRLYQVGSWLVELAVSIVMTTAGIGGLLFVGWLLVGLTS
jgi:hypothetical protein